MAITRTQVIEAFRWILGRVPESEEVILWHLRHGDIHALRISLLNSDEFRRQYERRPSPVKGSAILVTTTLALWLLELDSGRAWQIDTGKGAYCGLTFDQSHIYVAGRQAGYSTDREHEENVILCIDRKLHLTGVLRPPRPIRDVHQVFCHEGELFICSTYDDAVLIHNFASGGWNIWEPFRNIASGMRDENHINSVYVYDDTILLAGCEPKGWFAAFDRKRNPISGGKQLLGSMTHNIWREGDQTWVCSSKGGSIVSSSGDQLVINPRAWLRGVCQVGDQFYVGISQELHRAGRTNSDCSVAAIDDEGRIIRSYSFLGYGMVYDIRALDEADPTHNRTVFSLEPGAIDDRFKTYETRDELIDL